MLIALYLGFNALIFTAAALYCLAKPLDVAAKLGFTSLSHSGRSEFLTIYVGLQLGLALFFAYTASEPALRGVGLVFALLLYIGLVPFRLISLARYAPVSSMTKKLAIGETLLLAGAIALTAAAATT